MIYKVRNKNTVGTSTGGRDELDLHSTYYFRKSFFEIKLFVLVRTFDIQLLEFGNGRNPRGTGIRQHPATEILPAPESCDIWPPSPDAGGPDANRNWPESGHGQEAGWIWPR
jgi:hypothetical protein